MNSVIYVPHTWQTSENEIDRMSHLVLIKTEVSYGQHSLLVLHVKCIVIPLWGWGNNVGINAKMTVNISFSCYQMCPFLFWENKVEDRENQKHVSSLQMKRNTYSQCDNVYTIFQQHSLDECADFWKNTKTLNICWWSGVKGPSGNLWYWRRFMFLPTSCW